MFDPFRNYRKTPLRWHHEEAFAGAARGPDGADGAFFIGVGGVVEVLAFVFDSQDAAIHELAQEIGVGPILGGLQAE